MLLIRSSTANLNAKLNLIKLSYPNGIGVQRLACSQNAGMKEYWEKNKELNRPISPHLSIYKPQITMVLSITHRATGIGLSAGLYAFGISQLIVNNNWANQLVQLHSFCPNVYLAAKFLFISSFYYHLFNGVRHLTWDMGKGYNLKHLYASGYSVVALSVLLTAITMSNL